MWFELQQINWDMVSAIVGSVALLFAVPGFLVGLYGIKKRLGHLEEQNAKSARALATLDKIRVLSKGEQDAIWSRRLEPGEFDYDDRMQNSIPIILIMNLKGGVGKTTITGNLAADCAKNGERVLAIDLDYQGSLSSLFLGQAGVKGAQIDERSKFASQIIGGEQNVDFALAAARPVKENFPDLSYIPTDSALANVENRLMLQWLIDETHRDIRLNLARILLSDEFQKRFDRILIDTGPRLSAAFIAGLVSSTHFLIPTILDQMSAASVTNTLKQISRLKPRIFPHLKLAGVVGSKTFRHKISEDSQDRGELALFTQRERTAIGLLKKGASEEFSHGDHFLKKCAIGEKSAIAEAAGLGLAYLVDDDARHMFEALGTEIRLRAPAKPRKSA